MSKFVLLADDSPDDIEILRDILQRTGVVNPIRVVRDGTQAINYLDGKGVFADRDVNPFPSVLILDLMMPNLDGWDVLEWLQSHPERSKLLVVVITSFAEQTQLHEAYALGANSFLVKPFSKTELEALIHHWPDAWMLSPTRHQQTPNIPHATPSLPEPPQPSAQ